MRCLPGTRKVKTPIIFINLADEKINGALTKSVQKLLLCTGSIVLCAEKFNACFCVNCSFRATLVQEGVADIHIPFSPYKQVKNPNPQFIEPADKKTIPFCRKMMEKSRGFSDRFEFLVHVAFSRSLGKRRRKPPVLRCRAIDALMQGMCFHYDPLAGNTGRVQCSITTLAIECGLATEPRKEKNPGEKAKPGALAITRATRALRSLADDFGLIIYDTEFDPEIGCNVPSNIQFTPALFEAIGVSMESLAAVRKSRAEWRNQQREKKGDSRLSLEELALNAFNYVRGKFRELHRERRLHGIKRARAARDAERSRNEIRMLVKRELTREISAGRFPRDMALISDEVERRTSERTIMSRDNYTRLSSAPA